MNFEKFKPLFHESWHDKIRPFIESEECDKIYAYLKKESQRGKNIAPLSSNVYRCFLETPLDKLKVVILGMCPYHTLKDGMPVADGLALSCSVTKQLQPSLDQFYKAIEKDVYPNMCLDCDLKHPDLSYLAHQGVLLFNAALTTEVNKAGSHLAIWEPFTRYVFENIIGPTGVPTIFLGKEAAKFTRYTGLFAHNFVVSHPASASYKNAEWDCEGVFSKVNQVLKEVNNYQINWLYEEPPF
jgi:uracil-DNA glycosylase